MKIEKERGIEITSTSTQINFPITNTMPDEYPFVPRFTKDNFKKPKIKKPFWKNGKLRHK